MPIRAENKARYPRGWARISFRIRFVRAAGRCECTGQCRTHTGRCAAVHGSAHPVTKSPVVLTTAHLDRTPENCDDTNLLAMCQRCHLAYDAPEHAANASHTRAEARAAGCEPLFALDFFNPEGL
ncbi:hypothetical protein [Catenulispora rubra]|uniref:hypothetical protein n=1 Tax=Catenulispora rubra TaxID=280293 RepID=UPI001E61140B|nr:hypothetical protein [Catenulispora rubra]